MMSVKASKNTANFDKGYNYCHFSKLLNPGLCDRLSNLSPQYFYFVYIPNSPLMKMSTDCRMITHLFHENFMLVCKSVEYVEYQSNILQNFHLNRSINPQLWFFWREITSALDFKISKFNFWQFTSEFNFRYF